VAVLESGGDGSGARVVSGSDDETVRVWDIDGKQDPVVLSGHTETVTCLALLEGGGDGSGARVVSGSIDGTMRVWDIDGKQDPVVLKGHTNGVTCVAVVEGGGDGSGARVVSGSRDKTVRVWDVDGKQDPVVLEAHTELRSCVVVVSSTAPSSRPSDVGQRAVASRGRRGAECGGASLIFIGPGGTVLVDSGRKTLTHLPSPPGVMAVCCPAPGCVAWGTASGRVFFGRLAL